MPGTIRSETKITMTTVNFKMAGEILRSPDWTEAEKLVVRWQFGLLGDFRQALMVAIARADDINLAKLSEGFETEVTGFLAWSRGDLATRLRAAGLEI